MNNKLIWIVIFISISTSAMCQDFLKLKKEQIKETVPKNFGEIANSKDINKPPFILGAESAIYFTFPLTQKDGVWFAMFFFSKSQTCFKYIIRYNDSFQKNIVAKYDNPASGYKRKNGELKWVSDKEKVEVDLSKIAKDGTPTQGITLDIYLIQVSNYRSK